MGRSGLFVAKLSFLQDLDVVASVAGVGGDEADGAVAMLFVVPADEGGRPFPGLFEAGESLRREGRAVFVGPKERF